MADIASGRDDAPAEAEAPRQARAELRDSIEFLLVLALLAGVLAGLSVLAIDALLINLRILVFGSPDAAHLSDAQGLERWRVLLVPCAGGIVVGVASTLLRRWRPREAVDAIEANALFGGRMSLTDSVGVVVMTILSGGFGASIGLEAAYTQMGSAFGSRLGSGLGLRRDDIRTLVGGAAGAIGAAFNAPLAGAFYAFELILGSYTLATLAPVGIAALAGVLVVRAVEGSNPIFIIDQQLRVLSSDYAIFFAIGLISAGLGILAMKGVTGTEAL